MFIEILFNDYGNLDNYLRGGKITLTIIWKSIVYTHGFCSIY